MRVVASALLRVGNADLGQQVNDSALTFGARQPVMLLQDFANLPADGENRVERRHRLLENHGDAAAGYGTSFRRWQGQHIATLEMCLAGLDNGVGRQ